MIKRLIKMFILIPIGSIFICLGLFFYAIPYYVITGTDEGARKIINFGDKILDL